MRNVSSNTHLKQSLAKKLLLMPKYKSFLGLENWLCRQKVFAPKPDNLKIISGVYPIK